MGQTINCSLIIGVSFETTDVQNVQITVVKKLIT